MKKVSPLIASFISSLMAVPLIFCALAFAQSNPSATVAPGSSWPGVGGLGLGLDGPGYIEVGGSHSDLSGTYSNWNDFYLRGVLSGGPNTVHAELTHEDRFSDSGWFGTLGLTHTFSPDWYGQFSGGASVGGFFLPRYSFTGVMNRKLLSRKQLVVDAGVGFDQSKTVNYDERFQGGAAYYFSQVPVVMQGGLMWTHTTPGSVFARTQFLAVNEGYEKEHYFTLRYEWGREGYEVIGPPSSATPANVLFDFPEQTITGTWRQWIGPNWGFNFNLEQHQETSYHRWGGTAGVFLDF